MTPEQLASIAASAYRHMTPWTAAQFHETLSRADAVLTTEGGAFVLGVVQYDVAEILALACAPEDQRKGQARRALTRFAETVAGQGAQRILLEVSAQNAPALAFYGHAGFTTVGRRKAYYPQPGSQPAADALVMERPVLQPT